MDASRDSEIIIIHEPRIRHATFNIIVIKNGYPFSTTCSKVVQFNSLVDEIPFSGNERYHNSSIHL